MLVNKKVLAAMKIALNIGMVAENPQAIPIIEAIQPVVQVDDIKLTGQVKRLKLSLAIAPGAVVTNELVAGYTCPAGKRAYVMTANVAGTTGATQIAVGEEGSTTEWGALSLRVNAGGIVSPLGAVWVDAGDCLGLTGSNNAADSAVQFAYFVVEVDW